MSVDLALDDPDRGPASVGADILEMARLGARLAAAGEAMMLMAAGSLAILRESEAVDELRQIRASGLRLLWDRHDARLWAADEFAAAVSVPSVTAGRRLDDGERLLTRLPRVLAALAAGALDAARVRVLLDETARLDDDCAGEVCDAVLADAATMTAAQVRRAVRREAVRRAPQLADDEFRSAMTRRHAVTFPGEVPGMACLRVEGPADQVAAAWQAATALAQWRVDQAADQAGGRVDSLTLDQARADAVLDLVAGLADGVAPADIKPLAVNVIVPPAGSPAELVGHGPLPATATPRPDDPRVREVRSWHVDSDGVVTVTGRARGYVPSPRLAATVRARDVTCRFPGCARRADRCDLDHVVPWPSGDTEYENLAALCRRHHRLKTHSRWRVEISLTGLMQWTSPTGDRYTTKPPEWISAARRSLRSVPVPVDVLATGSNDPPPF